MLDLIGGGMHFKRILIHVLVALLSALVLPLFAQEQFGTIAGVVRDPSKAVLPGVAVSDQQCH